MTTLTAADLIRGNRYNWKHDADNVLIYKGKNWSGNGFWHQFDQADKPDVVWCEVTDKEIPMFEVAK